MTNSHHHDGLAQCPVCGHPVDPADRHVRFTLPDPVVSLPHREQTTGAWLSHDTAGESVMMQVPDCGSFVRALLPVNLDDGTRITYGVWLAVHSDTLHSALAVWWSPDYPSLRLEGYLANELPPGGLLYAPAVAVVRDEQQTPYIHDSSHPALADLLQKVQPTSSFS